MFPRLPARARPLSASTRPGARARVRLLVLLALSAAPFLPASGPAQAAGPQARVTVVAQGLEHPWSLAFLPDGAMLITERPGRLRLLRDGRLSPPLAGVPEVAAQGQGGLLDVALPPGFSRNRYVYLSYAESDGKRSGTAVGRGRLSDDGRALEDFRVLFRQAPKLSTGVHYGARLVFDGRGYLYISLGENYQRMAAQDLDKLQGKIVRLREDGSVPPDNPYAGKPGARAEIWSYGHRNPQGLALHPRTGQLWESEHGPRGGDEVNLVKRGANYGWPLATYGIDYSGRPIPEARGGEAPGTAAALLVEAIAGHQRHGVLRCGPLPGMAQLAVPGRAGRPRPDPADPGRRQGGGRGAVAGRAFQPHPRRAPGTGRLCLCADRRFPRRIAEGGAGATGRVT